MHKTLQNQLSNKDVRSLTPEQIINIFDPKHILSYKHIDPDCNIEISYEGYYLINCFTSGDSGKVFLKRTIERCLEAAKSANFFKDHVLSVEYGNITLNSFSKEVDIIYQSGKIYIDMSADYIENTSKIYFETDWDPGEHTITYIIPTQNLKEALAKYLDFMENRRIEITL